MAFNLSPLAYFNWLTSAANKTTEEAKLIVEQLWFKQTGKLLEWKKEELREIYGHEG